MTSLLIVNKDQFGYHTDTFAYCHYSREQFDTSYLCLDQGRPRISLNGISVRYVNPRMNNFKLVRAISFWLEVWKMSNKFDVVFVKYFPFCSAFTRRKKHVLLDIRTRSVKPKVMARRVENCLLRIEILRFPNVSVVSNRVAELLHLPSAIVIPLGTFLRENSGDDPAVSSLTENSFQTLICVGTLENRNMDVVIRGLALFNEKHIGNRVRLKLFGDDRNPTGAYLRDLSSSLSLDDCIDFLGWVSQIEITEDVKNVLAGIVQVPENEIYDGQPSTKLFEYWSFGIPVLASRNRESQRYLNDQLGVVYEQTPEGFSVSLGVLMRTRETFQKETILENVKKYSWEKVYQKDLSPALNRVLSNSSGMG